MEYEENQAAGPRVEGREISDFRFPISPALRDRWPGPWRGGGKDEAWSCSSGRFRSTASGLGLLIYTFIHRHSRGTRVRAPLFSHGWGKSGNTPLTPLTPLHFF